MLVLLALHMLMPVCKQTHPNEALLESKCCVAVKCSAPVHVSGINFGMALVQTQVECRG